MTILLTSLSHLTATSTIKHTVGSFLSVTVDHHSFTTELTSADWVDVHVHHLTGGPALSFVEVTMGGSITGLVLDVTAAEADVHVTLLVALVAHLHCMMRVEVGIVGLVLLHIGTLLSALHILTSSLHLESHTETLVNIVTGKVTIINRSLHHAEAHFNWGNIVVGNPAVSVTSLFHGVTTHVFLAHSLSSLTVDVVELTLFTTHLERIGVVVEMIIHHLTLHDALS